MKIKFQAFAWVPLWDQAGGAIRVWRLVELQPEECLGNYDFGRPRSRLGATFCLSQEPRTYQVETIICRKATVYVYFHMVSNVFSTGALKLVATRTRNPSEPLIDSSLVGPNARLESIDIGH